jgi:uncharacterized protein DUF6166
MPADRRPAFARHWLAVLGLLRRRHGSGRSARLYVGHRGTRAEAYIVTREGVTPLTHRAFGADAALDWGTPGAGAAALSFALLCDATHRPPPDALVAKLVTDVVADLPADGFVLDAEDLRRWLAHRRLGPAEEAVAQPARYRRWLEALALAQPWPAYPFLVPMAAPQRDDGAGDAEDAGRPSAAASGPERPAPLRRRRR